ncbi:uncharacterized protein LOC142235785 [Haematobia irritans]|uniref:uncharacterized protein LOC142235785 n=1 Tax=Haematobia irritans TaxID=7368 RepID=UPI003F4FB4FB
MKVFTVLGVIAICALASSAAPKKVVENPIVVVPTPAPTMVQDLKEILQMVNFRQIQELMSRYLLNDAEFQSFVRIINSRDAYLMYMRFRSQPEVMAFVTWVRAQIKASGQKFKIKKMEGEMALINVSPFWANTVFGWQGFVSEFMLHYPADMITVHVSMKVAENGIFAQFWQRLNALKPVYEQIMASLEAQRVITALQMNGIDVAQLDTFIRNQFGWQLLLPAGTNNTTVTASIPAF